MPQPRACRPALTAVLTLSVLLHGCATADRDARKDVETLQTNVQQMESTIQARQAGVYEQIRDLREEQNRLERLIDEQARAVKTAGQQLERMRERTQEEFDTRDRVQRDGAQATTELINRQGARIDNLQKDMQKSFQTLNDNILAMGTFEKKQEERIAKIQEQFQSQLKVVVEEVGQENQALTRSVTALRADLEAARQESTAARQGLADLQASVQQIADQLATAQRQLQDAVKKQEAARKAAPAGGQHTVKSGETLTIIAARYGISVQALMEKNQITDADSIRVGQKLAVPEH